MRRAVSGGRDGAAVERLLRSEEPSLRWKARVEVLGDDPESRGVRALREEVRRSRRARAMLGGRTSLGRSGTARAVYYKWQGFQWTLMHLADLGYPAGDAALGPIRDRVLELWLRPYYLVDRPIRPGERATYGTGVPVINGRHRRCASQQGNALYFLTALGLDDGRSSQLAERLLHWQWPDGGWNCDHDPTADTSSFFETLLPLRGLAAFGAATHSRRASAAAGRAAEVFLSRHLYRRRSNGEVMRREFVRLHYPTYYQYDILAGLRGMAAAGKIRDRRCDDALDLLESKRLPEGGWPADGRFYRRVRSTLTAQSEWVAWGGTGPGENPWVTAEALAVLSAAGRLAL